MLQKKMTLHHKDGRKWEFVYKGSFWAYDDNETRYRIFLDNRGLWIGKLVKDKSGVPFWEKLTGVKLEMDEGTLKF
jgi:hypothetical protein